MKTWEDLLINTGGLMWNSSTFCPLAVCGSSWMRPSINSFQRFTPWTIHSACCIWSLLSLIPGVKILILSPRPLPSPFISMNLKQSPLVNLLLLLSLPDLSVPTRSQDHKAPGSASSLCSQGEPVGGQTDVRAWDWQDVGPLGEQEALGTVVPKWEALA